jgi:hypothetical protein
METLDPSNRVRILKDAGGMASYSPFIATLGQEPK